MKNSHPQVQQVQHVQQVQPVGQEPQAPDLIINLTYFSILILYFLIKAWKFFRFCQVLPALLLVDVT